jgi:hypothetical protein
MKLLIISSLFGPNILLSTLFSNTHSLCSSLTVRDQVSCPYKTTGKVVVWKSTYISEEHVASIKKQVAGSYLRLLTT